MKSSCKNLKQGEEGKNKPILLPQVKGMETKNIKNSKRKDRRKITDSQSLLKEDFYSDPRLATTLQGT